MNESGKSIQMLQEICTVSTINTSVKDCDRTKNTVKEPLLMKSTMIMKARSGIISVSVVRFSAVVKFTLVLITSHLPHLAVN